MAEESVGGISAKIELDDTNLTAQLAKLRTALTTVEDKLHVLGQSFGQTGVAAALHSERIDRLIQSKAQLKARIDDVTASLVREATATRALDTAGGVGLGGGRGAAISRAALDLSRGLEDLAVAGPLGVINNIPGIVANVGQAAQLSATQVAMLTTAFSLAGTAAYLAYVNWDRLVDLMGTGGTLTEAEHMDRLERNTGRTADQQKRLNEYKKEQQQIDAMMGMKSKAETAIAAGTAAVLAEAGPEEVLAGIIKARTEEGRFIEQDEKYGKLQELREKRAKLKAQLDRNELTEAEAMSLGAAGAAPGVREQKLATVQESRRQAMRRLDDEEIALRKEMFDRQKQEARRTMLDPKALLAEVERNPEKFAPNLADELRKVYPPTPQTTAIDVETDRILKQRRELEKEDEKDRAKERAKTMEEIMVQEEMEAFDASEMATKLSPRQLAEKARLEERGGDLDWKLRQLLNPEKIGQAMGIAEYGRSFKATTGITKEEQLLRQIHEVNEEIALNTKKLDKLNIIAVAKPGGG